MSKKIRRILSALLVLVLLVSVCPVQGSAAAGSDQRAEALMQRIRDVYRASQQGSGRYSFYGYCGTMVSWQLYILGITDVMRAADGRRQYDMFAGLEYSSGGYRVRAYPVSQYSMKDAMNAITEYGTKDVYNILVGFERTPSEAGMMYGHALVIFGILDGIVYYNESSDGYFSGVHYSEGSPIACSIDEFSRRYEGNVYEGMIYFGEKTYAEDCTRLPAHLYAQTTVQTQMYTAPCLPETDERSEPVRLVQAGERLHITGLYENTVGEYWYQIQGSEPTYIRAEDAEAIQMLYDDVVVEGLDVPWEMRGGLIYNIEGRIRASYNRICTVRAQLFAHGENSLEHWISTTQNLHEQQFSLYRTALANQLHFEKLPQGTYRLELAVVVGNYYFADGAVQTQWKTLDLWNSDFRVVPWRGESYNVKFDAAGGSTELHAISIKKDNTLQYLPVAHRDGYHFDGWYTADGILAEPGMVISTDMTLTARWRRAEDRNGWFLENDRWIYLENGQPVYGFIREEITYHVSNTGIMDTGWQTIDGRQFFFYETGAMHLGWMETEFGTYYFTATGAATGWMYINDLRYYFNDQGILQTGEQTIDEEIHQFDENGVWQG